MNQLFGIPMELIATLKVLINESGHKEVEEALRRLIENNERRKENILISDICRTTNLDKHTAKLIVREVKNKFK